MHKEIEIAIVLKDSTLAQEIADIAAQNSTVKIVEYDKGPLPNYIITDISQIKKIDEPILLEHGEKIILLSDKSDEENISTYLEHYPINHLIGTTGNNVSHEIDIVLKKLCSINIWGLKPYFPDSTRIIQQGIENTHDLDNIVTKNLSQLNLEQYFDSPIDYLKLIANELLTNALYNGIAHRDSLNPRKEISRKEDVFLKGSELILFSCGANASAIGISVQDSFGKLDRTKVVAGLVRGFKEKKALDKQGGAGLGFYVIYNHCNQLIINVKRNSRTEVIALIDHNRRYKKYKERITSFHFYEEVNK